jgi:lincosamide nucleotidyltransferase A/C/D/E
VAVRRRQRVLARGKQWAVRLGERAFNVVAVGPLHRLRTHPRLNRLRMRWHGAMDVACTLADVLNILDVLDRAGVPAWLGGGWGVDALVGHQTRRHSDLDLIIRAVDQEQIFGVLQKEGFGVSGGGDVPPRPGEFLLARHVVRDSAGRTIDLHVVDVRKWPPGDPDRQLFTRGSLHGRPVGCLSIEALRTATRTGLERNDHKPEYHLNLRTLDEVESRA